MPAALQSRLRGAGQNLSRGGPSYDEWLTANGLQGNGRFSPGPQAIHAYNAMTAPVSGGNRLQPAPQYAGGGITQRQLGIQRAAEDRQRRAAEEEAQLAQQREMEQLRLTTGTQYNIAAMGNDADLARQNMVGQQQFNQLQEQGMIEQTIQREIDAARMRLQELSGRQDMAALQEKGEIEQRLQELRGAQAMEERRSINENSLLLNDRDSVRAYNLQDMQQTGQMDQIDARGGVDRNLQQMRGVQGLQEIEAQGGVDRNLLQQRGVQDMDVARFDRQTGIDRLDKANQYQLTRDQIQNRHGTSIQESINNSYGAQNQARIEADERSEDVTTRRQRLQEGWTLTPAKEKKVATLTSEKDVLIDSYQSGLIELDQFEPRLKMINAGLDKASIPTVPPQFDEELLGKQIIQNEDGSRDVRDARTGEYIQTIAAQTSPGPKLDPHARTKMEQAALEGERRHLTNLYAHAATLMITPEGGGELRAMNDQEQDDWVKKQVGNAGFRHLMLDDPEMPVGGDLTGSAVRAIRGGEAPYGPRSQPSGLRNLQPSQFAPGPTGISERGSGIPGVLPRDTFFQKQLMQDYPIQPGDTVRPQPQPDTLPQPVPVGDRTSFEKEQDEEFEGVFGQDDPAHGQERDGLIRRSGTGEPTYKSVSPEEYRRQLQEVIDADAPVVKQMEAAVRGLRDDEHVQNFYGQLKPEYVRYADYDLNVLKGLLEEQMHHMRTGRDFNVIHPKKVEQIQKLTAMFGDKSGRLFREKYRFPEPTSSRKGTRGRQGLKPTIPSGPTPSRKGTRGRQR